MSEMDDESLAIKAIKDGQLLSELLQNLSSKKDEIRYPSFNAVLIISEKHPKLLYPEWDLFIDLLKSDNNYQKLIAIRLIANLISVDIKNKFEKIFDEYYGILENEKTMTAGHLTAVSGKIIKAKPKLETIITNKLLNIDKIHPGKQIELIKAYAIEAFDEYYKDAQDKKRILEFVKNQLESESPKTRKKAKEFLEKWDK